MGAIAAGSAGFAVPRAFAAAAQPGSRPLLLPRALAALDAHASKIKHRDILGLVDFSAPSAVPRLEIVDLAGARILASFLVAHGRGSDPGNTGWAHTFSNRQGSNASCRGSFALGNLYCGEHGRSRRLVGLDPENSNAASRAIVVHAADYVSPGLARMQGRIGRSLGCFAVPQADIAEVLHRLDEGRLLFAWS